MTALEAAEKMQLPPGFKATVFAAEPDVQNPIAMAWDARGRLWVAENYTYAEAGTGFDLHLRDRIVIFEDTDGDGRFDKRRVFTDELQMLTGIEIGHGGVWVTCPPQLLFIPDRNGDDVPDGPPEVVLDGFNVSMESHHTFANGLRFGPDGWLYGRCGASCPGEIGRPGTALENRIPLRGTMWRYHPQRQIVETLSSGTTNPWGHDWNEHGELFFINTVNGHLWHGLAGAHYARPHTIDPNPHAYALIDQHADHYHFDTSQDWTKSRDGAANSFGGGHAHVGMMFYLGDNWPATYRGHLFTLNLHGRRMNQEIIERLGSGYVGHHGPDLGIAADTWFRGMELSYGPDGGVFVLDWSDTGECHESTGVHRTSGRIYKVSYENARHVSFPSILGATPTELVTLLAHPNAWFARQAQLELAARASDGRGTGAAKAELLSLFTHETNAVAALRDLWSLYVIGGADEAFLHIQLRHPNEHVRAWAIRLLTDDWPLDTALSERPKGRAEGLAAGESSLWRDFCQMAEEDPSGLVRLVLASTLQRMPIAQRPKLAAALVSHPEDAHDHNLPLLTWYGLIPVAAHDPAGLLPVAAKCEWPWTRQFIARRLAENVELDPGPLNGLLQFARTEAGDSVRIDLLTGISEALTGWRRARKPEAWDALALDLAKNPNPDLQTRVRELSVVFGDGRALEQVKQVALDHGANLAARKAALQTLIDNRQPDLQALCQSLVKVPFLDAVAARGLATFNDSATGRLLAGAYRQFHPSERPQLLSVLVSRPVFVKALLEAVDRGTIPRADLSTYHVRQIQTLHDPEIDSLLVRAWGELHESSWDKKQFVSRLKERLTGPVLAEADLSQGRVVFNTACATCHRLYGEGGDVGPDLTGTGRGNLDYLLENVVDPSAIVSADFRMSVVNIADGRTLNGFIRAHTERTLTLQTMTEKLILNRTEVTGIEESKLSLMPEGLLETLTETQRRDLIAYLLHLTQVPLPAAAAVKAGD